MKITEVDTIIANIYVGLRVRYTQEILDFGLAYEVCQKYVNKIGLAVTFTKTEYIYTDGNEPGLIIGLINYPRFPSDYETIKNHAITLALKLQEQLEQTRISIVMNDKTYMLSDEGDTSGFFITSE